MASLGVSLFCSFLLDDFSTDHSLIKIKKETLTFLSVVANEIAIFDSRLIHIRIWPKPPHH
jgi:hypothetical protein